MNLAVAQATSGNGLALFVVASLAVIALAAVASKYLANWQSIQTRGRRLRVLEGVPIGKDRTLLLVSVGNELLVLGSSSSGVSLVHKVEDQEAAAAMLAEPAMPPELEMPGGGALEVSVRTSLERMRGLMTRIRGGADA
jgi:flagellar biogenesis protein FliO